MTSKLDNKTVLFIGLGMIGGSIALGLRKVYPDTCILACDSDKSTCQDAVEKSIVKAAVLEADAETFIAKADLIVIALPPLLCAEVLVRIEAAAAQHCVVCDVSSVKGHIKKTTYHNHCPDMNDHPRRHIDKSRQIIRKISMRSTTLKCSMRFLTYQHDGAYRNYTFISKNDQGKNEKRND